MSSATPEPLMTRQEAARYLRVSITTLNTYVRNGVLPVRRLPGGHPRYSRQDIDLAMEHGGRRARHAIAGHRSFRKPGGK